jgi:putative ABC transport system ATP-binding protein
LIRLQNITHRYSSELTIAFPDINISGGEKLLISGNSGSGKTTLMHIAAGILKPTEGEVVFNDISLYKLSSGKIDDFRGKNIGIVFQKAHLVKNLTVLENILAAMYFSGNKISKEKALEILSELNILDQKDKLPYSLSQGQSQRAAIAKALVNNPQVIFADEPTSGLDDFNTEAVINLLLTVAKNNNSTLIVSSHDARLKNIFNQVVTLKTLK